jgi:glycosyltransferase involved in cell wall biosynthesis
MRKPIICHVSTLQNPNQMNDNSRHIYYKSYGRHIFCNINDEPPKADIYFLECFIKDARKFKYFIKPYSDSKIISFIHSSRHCGPSIYSDKIVVLTNTWKDKMLKKGFDSIVINNAIDINLYKYDIDYNNKVFGRITRYSDQKVHKDFNDIALNTLNTVKNSKCIIFCDNYENKPKHSRFIVDDSIKIDESEKKAKKLSQLSLCADMHNIFVEVFPMGLLESMASGHCCLMYSKVYQKSTKEILGDAGVWCKTTKEFRKKLIELLKDSEQKKEYGLRAKARAKRYTIEKMIEKYDKLFREVLS